jgi:hypothetical protein
MGTWRVGAEVMKKRFIDLREAGSSPMLLDIVSYGRTGKPFTPAQKDLSLP